MKNNKKPCRLILSKEQRIALLDGFQKQNTHTTVAEYAKANNVTGPTLRGWSVRYGMPLGRHHRNHRTPLPKEQKIALLEGFQKQNTHTTIESYAKANNLKLRRFHLWSVRYGMPLGWHHRNHRKILPKEQKLALLDGFQKQSTHTTIESYAKANNVRKDALRRWAVLYGMPLGHHYTKRIQKTPSTNVIKKKPIHDDPLLEALRKQYHISQE